MVKLYVKQESRIIKCLAQNKRFQQNKPAYAVL